LAIGRREDTFTRFFLVSKFFNILKIDKNGSLSED
jgi:hypothetical protein